MLKYSKKEDVLVSRRTVRALKKILRDNGIKVNDDFFYAHMLNIDGRLAAAEEFGRKNIA